MRAFLIILFQSLASLGTFQLLTGILLAFGPVLLLGPGHPLPNGGSWASLAKELSKP